MYNRNLISVKVENRVGKQLELLDKEAAFYHYSSSYI
jgi:hypothetical protein